MNTQEIWLPDPGPRIHLSRKGIIKIYPPDGFALRNWIVLRDDGTVRYDSLMEEVHDA